eukprot:2723946-Amphidinium_carterae.1
MPWMSLDLEIHASGKSDSETLDSRLMQTTAALYRRGGGSFHAQVLINHASSECVRGNSTVQHKCAAKVNFPSPEKQVNRTSDSPMSTGTGVGTVSVRCQGRGAAGLGLCVHMSTIDDVDEKKPADKADPSP